MPTPTTTERTIVVDQQVHANLLRMAFDQICDRSDWKGPIDALIPWASASVYTQAVEFMTGVRAQCDRVTGANGEDLGHLTAIGYRAGPCGDH